MGNSLLSPSWSNSTCSAQGLGSLRTNRRVVGFPVGTSIRAGEYTPWSTKISTTPCWTWASALGRHSQNHQTIRAIRATPTKLISKLISGLLLLMAGFKQAQPVGIGHHGNGGQGHGRPGEHRVQQHARDRIQDACGDGNAQHVIDKGTKQVLLDIAKGRTGDFDRSEERRVGKEGKSRECTVPCEQDKTCER